MSSHKQTAANGTYTSLKFPFYPLPTPSFLSDKALTWSMFFRVRPSQLRFNPHSRTNFWRCALLRERHTVSASSLYFPMYASPADTFERDIGGVDNCPRSGQPVMFKLLAWLQSKQGGVQSLKREAYTGGAHLAAGSRQRMLTDIRIPP